MKFKNIILIFLLIISRVSSAQIIKTVAGTGTAGYTGDSGPAINATFSRQCSVKLDDLGNMYIADWHNNAIRKINTKGIISTIAGTSVYGNDGDGGLATNAKIASPGDVVLDGKGNIYISSDYAIRKINSSGIISTIAGNGVIGYSGDGGPATNASISDPLGLVFDKAGNLYFSNNGNYVVRKINTAGIISTVAGTGVNGYNGDGISATAAKVGLTGFLAIGPDNNLYIPDYTNHRIRKIDESGIITTVIGNGINSNTGDGGPASVATIQYITGILFDPSNNMYLSDGGIGIIRKINTLGIINTIAGIGILGYGGDNGPATAAQFNSNVFCSAVDGGGNLYISDDDNNRIRRITYNSTGIENINPTTQNISIYPSPARDQVSIEDASFSATTMAGNGNQEIQVYNTIGQLICRTPFSKQTTTITTTTYPPGLYFVHVAGLYAGRFIKE